jgi:hypothetical protein
MKQVHITKNGADIIHRLDSVHKGRHILMQIKIKRIVIDMSIGNDLIYIVRIIILFFLIYKRYILYIRDFVVEGIG